MATFQFFRHGESDANILRVFSNRALPHHLTAAGIAAAEEMAMGLARTPTAIWSSPVLRARETAAIFSKQTGVPYRVADGLREYDVGRFEGTDDPAGWHEYSSVLAAWRLGDTTAAVGGGESLDEIKFRFVPFIEDLIETAHEDDFVVLVSHGGLYRAALPFVLANVGLEYTLSRPFGHMESVLTETDSGVLVCRTWCGAEP
jgi:probable phosphoglycerate mutase